MHRSYSAILLLLLIVLMIVLQMQQLSLQEILRYERDLMVSEPWRAISHAFIHLNFNHMLLNVTAIICLYFLFSAAFETVTWFAALIFCSAVSAAGMYWFSQDVDWCVGLSGGLHGLFLYVVMRAGAHWFWILALVAKIIDEQFHLLAQFEWSAMSSELINGDVVVDAHLWGALGGLFLILLRALPSLFAIIEINRD